MESYTTLAVIGGGRMGEAIIGGLLAADALPAADIVVVEPDAARRDSLAATHGVRCVAEAAEGVPGAGTVLLAVKPQVIGDVVAVLAPLVAPGALVVSIAAGVSCARLESLLPPATAVVRVMPNTPALVREGMAVVSPGAAADAVHVARVERLFSAVGDVVVLDERYQDAATAISGSGPAYFAIMVGAVEAAGARQGLPADVARTLAERTMRGTAGLLLATGQSPEELVAAVSSPGGTTVAATRQLDSRGFREAVDAAVEAAVARSKELGA